MTLTTRQRPTPDVDVHPDVDVTTVVTKTRNGTEQHGTEQHGTIHYSIQRVFQSLSLALALAFCICGTAS